MKPTMKNALRDAFEAPAPADKRDFLRTLPQPGISHLSFMLIQAGYIRRWVWALSILLFISILTATLFTSENTLWMLSAVIPFVALSAVAENARSQAYGMAELEMASRFSLKSVILARMAILGLCHFCLLALLIPLASLNAAAEMSGKLAVMAQSGIYILVPYLLTTVCGLWIVRKIHTREAIYGCTAVAVLVSAADIALRSAASILFQRAYFHRWVLALGVLVLLTALEYYKTIRQTEELSWNLS